ncbi:MAG TPA: transcription termination factor Rho [Myxococcales bacterium]
MTNGQEAGPTTPIEQTPQPERQSVASAPPQASAPAASAAPGGPIDPPMPMSNTGNAAPPYPQGNQGHGGGGGGQGGQGTQQGQPGQEGGRRGRRRRRRRRKGGQPGQPGQVQGQGQNQNQQGGQQGQQMPGAPFDPNAPAQQPAQGEGGIAQAGGQPQAQPQLIPAEGVLDTEVKGNICFLRQLKRNMMAAGDDPEIPRPMVQRLRLRPGSYIKGAGYQRGARVQLQRVESVDGDPAEVTTKHPQFQDLTVVDPERRIQLEHSSTDMVTRVLDLIAPIGFGQRGLIVSPPKAGKTIMLQRIAQAITENHPKAHLMVLLVDERPEEVTDMRRSIKGEVMASSSDRPTSDHLQVAEMTLDRARRLVEQGKDVVILLDSITRLARAYNKEVESSGRTLTGGVDSRALERPKRIFGSARKTEEAGSLTILGTALIDTGSRMDEVIFEEFKGTGNMEVTLDRTLGERRIWPAINIPQSGTRKEEKLMTPKEYEKVKKLRQMLFAMKPSDAMEKLVKKLAEYESNDEFLDAV